MEIAIENTFCHAANLAENAAIRWQDAATEMMRPHVLMKPSISIDGNMWCALYGENLQDGVAGFGKSPEEAMAAFDEEWKKELLKEE